MIDVYRDDNGKPVLLGCCELSAHDGPLRPIMVRRPLPMLWLGKIVNEKEAADFNRGPIECFHVVWVGDLDLYDRGVVPAIKLADGQDPALLFGWQPA